MFTEGAPKVHICRAFPLSLTVSPERNPLVFYLVNIRNFKLAVGILRSIMEEAGERENLIFLKAGISALSALCYLPPPQLCLVPQVLSQINPIN